MTFAQLRDAALSTLFPDGAPENILDSVTGGIRVKGAASRFLEQCLSELQQFVPCLKEFHINVYDDCAQYFQCGMTVIPAPDGAVLSVSTVDRLDANLNEKRDEPIDWCSRVRYRNVPFDAIREYQRLCESRVPLGQRPEAALLAPFKPFFPKHAYVTPNDAREQRTMPLSFGLHHVNATADAPGRSPVGFWAIKAGRIYVAPWVQSTESVVVEWEGMKKFWGEGDTVLDEPLIVEAATAYLGMQVALYYESDSGRYEGFKAQYYGNPQAGIVGVLPKLAHWCRERSRGRAARAIEEPAGTADGVAATPVGIGSGSGGGGGLPGTAYYNERQTATAYCPEGKVGDPANGVVEAGEIVSYTSLEDANQRARNLALERANAALDCRAPAQEFLNDLVEYIEYCPATEGAPAPEGDPVAIRIEPGTISSTVSQEAANAAALEFAKAMARAGLTCKYRNRAKTVSFTCPGGGVKTGTVAEGELEQVVSQQPWAAHLAAQANLDAQAEALARSRAQSQCPGGGGGGGQTGVGNTQQYSAFRCITQFCNYAYRCPNGAVVTISRPVQVTVNVVAAVGSVRADTEANANSLAQSLVEQFARSFGSQSSGCSGSVFTINYQVVNDGQGHYTIAGGCRICLEPGCVPPSILTEAQGKCPRR
jgi:hypothetical protein